MHTALYARNWVLFFYFQNTLFLLLYFSADDSTLSVSNKDPQTLQEAIKNKYKDIADYMSRNKLILIMSSARKHQRYGNFEIILDTGNEIIVPKTTENLLGGIVSNNTQNQCP